jgi:hypothetical protein
MHTEDDGTMFEHTLESLSSPPPLRQLEELEEELELHPRYIGPGLWYTLIASGGSRGERSSGEPKRASGGRNRRSARFPYSQP